MASMRSCRWAYFSGEGLRVLLVAIEDGARQLQIGQNGGKDAFTLPAPRYGHILPFAHPFLTIPSCSHAWKKPIGSEISTSFLRNSCSRSAMSRPYICTTSSSAKSSDPRSKKALRPERHRVGVDAILHGGLPRRLIPT